MKKEDLAINRYKTTIIEMIQNNSVVVIEAPTGSGKTTQIPQIIFESGLNQWGIIGVTQPRRIAAFSVANRISYEMDVELGRLVGYKMRFDDLTSSQTQIKVMTDGILLEELRSDPLLLKYSVIMVDEAHERSLNIDFILGLLKDVLRKRNDLKIVVSSATINASLFSKFFNNAPILSVDARQFPVEIKYIPLTKQNNPDLIIEKIIEIVKNLEQNKINGDILVFLEGEQSIKECCEQLELLKVNNGLSLVTIPLYARLSPEDQNKVFLDFPDNRKIVVSTNIAETSITIDGITHVIDPGYCKLNYYNPRTFTSFLEVKPISKASCAQRMGRAGRTAPGIVYRLYSEEDYINRDNFTKEEIYRTDLSEVVLRMADLGIRDFSDFDFISEPKKGAILSAIETLISIEALNKNHELTEIGAKMVYFPLEPRFSRILLESVISFPEVGYNVLIVIAFLSTKRPFLYPHGEEIESRQAQKILAEKGGDFFSWINLFYKYIKEKNKEQFCEKFYLDIRSMNEIVNIHSQLIDMLHEKKYSTNKKFDYNAIIHCICSGLKQYICKKSKKQKTAYHSATEVDVRIHPGSYLFRESPGWIVGGEIVNTGRTYIRSAAFVPEIIIKNNFKDVYQAITKKYLTKLEVTSTKPKKIKEERIYIFDKYFEIKYSKNGYFLHVPYQILIQLKKKKEKILEMDIDNIKSKLIFKGKVILVDKLSSLVKYFDKIDLDNGLNTKWPKNQQFLYPDDWVSLFRYIKLLLKPTLTQNNSIRAGFLALDITKENWYEYYLEKDFFYALEISLKSMESLYSSEITAWNDKEKIVLETIHHKLINLAEEMDV